MYPHFDRDDVLAFRVSRVRYVLPLSDARLLQIGAAASPPSVPGVFPVNSSQIVNGTLNVNETIQLAERAAISATGGGSEAGEGSRPPATEDRS